MPRNAATRRAVDAHPRARRRRAAAASLHGRLRARAERTRPRRDDIQLSLHRAAAQGSRSHAAARRVLSRGDRRGARGDARARASGSSSAASRWAAAPRRTSPQKTRALTLAGIVLLGYPLHPPGTARPTSRRASARTSGAPCCSCRARATRFGTPSELKPILASLSPLPTLHHVEGGDHSFKIAGRDAKARQAAVYAEIQDTIVEWIQHDRLDRLKKRL